MYRFLLIFHFIASSIRHGVGPWRFFQLNASYFNVGKGIYSKLDIDALIPNHVRLLQVLDDGDYIPEKYPVFVKPEWGQNSYGITRVDDLDSLTKTRKKNDSVKTPFLIQEVASEKREYEIFYIRGQQDPSTCEIFSITEVINSDPSEKFPINGIYNPSSTYHDITDKFSAADKVNLWQQVENIGHFRIARVGLRANSIKELLEGSFHIVEINIFLPMPLYLLDKTISFQDKYLFIRRSMTAATKAVRTIPIDQERKSIFFRKVRAHYRVKT